MLYLHIVKWAHHQYLWNGLPYPYNDSGASRGDLQLTKKQYMHATTPINTACTPVTIAMIQTLLVLLLVTLLLLTIGYYY